MIIMETTRDFTVTTTIVFGNKVLLHFHKSLKKWLPIGGHIDRDELPEDAARREAKEEAGIDIVLYNPDQFEKLKEGKYLVRPACLMLQDINEHHQHIDFGYYATTNTFDLKPSDGEAKDLHWFTAEEIKVLDAPDNVKSRALDALKILGNK